MSVLGEITIPIIRYHDIMKQPFLTYEIRVKNMSED